MRFAGQHKAGLSVTPLEFQIRQSRKIVASDVVPEIFALKEERPVSRCGFGAVDLCPRYARDRAGVDNVSRIDAQFRPVAQRQIK